VSTSKCKCPMAISMLGDGCRYCQPQEYIDRLEEWLGEERTRVAEFETAAQDNEEPFTWCFTDVNGKASSLADDPKTASAQDMRVYTALYTRPLVVIPKGYKLVPIESDQWMRTQGEEGFESGSVIETWDRMLRAAPAPPSAVVPKSATSFAVRGFQGYNFLDFYKHEFSLQKSSLATEDCLWFGLNNVNPLALHGDAKRLGVKTTATSGWVPYPLPEEVNLNTRMHLSRGQVAELIPVLQHFVATGDLPKQESE